MERRAFLRRISAGAVAAALVAETDGVQLFARPVTRVPVCPESWTWIRWSGFKASPFETRHSGQLLARRNDGEYIAVYVPLAMEEFSVPHVDAAFQNALLTLETFRTCACRVGQPCPDHYVPPPTAEELAELGLDAENP